MGKIILDPMSLLCSVVSWEAWLAQCSCHHTEPWCSFTVLFLSSASYLTLNPNFSINTRAINGLAGTLMSYTLVYAICGLVWAQLIRALACLSHWLGKELFFVKWKCPAGCDAQFISSSPGRFDKWHGCSPPLHSHTQWHSLGHDCYCSPDVSTMRLCELRHFRAQRRVNKLTLSFSY